MQEYPTGAASCLPVHHHLRRTREHIIIPIPNAENTKISWIPRPRPLSCNLAGVWGRGCVEAVAVRFGGNMVRPPTYVDQGHPVSRMTKGNSAVGESRFDPCHGEAISIETAYRRAAGIGWIRTAVRGTRQRTTHMSKMGYLDEYGSVRGFQPASGNASNHAVGFRSFHRFSGRGCCPAKSSQPLR